MLDLRRLEILHRFAALGTITATAAELGYSASAISQQLATLEREAGVALIERTARRATLTDAGRELAEHAALILSAAETAQSRMRARATNIGGRVTVSCIPSLAAGLAPHLAALQRRYPELSIETHETGSASAAAAVLERAYDLAVIDDWSQQSPAQRPGLSMYPLRREPVVLAVSDDHPLARHSGPLPAARLRQAAAEHTWLCALAGDFSRVAGDRYLATAGAVPARRWVFQGLHILVTLVAAGAGIALLPAGVAHGQPGVSALRLSPPMHRSVLALTRTAAQHDPAIAVCLHAAHQALHEDS